jgi:hypothetical protein
MEQISLWPFYLENFIRAAIILGFCGISRWFCIVTAALAMGVVAIGWVASLIFHYPISLIGNNCELFLIAVLVGLYFMLRNLRQRENICFPAIASAVCAVLNPAILTILFWLARLPVWIHGDRQLRSCAVASVAVVSGHIALIRIMKSRDVLQGRIFAWVGIVAGYLWLCGWIFFPAALMWAMSRLLHRAP